ncbi:MAG: PIG-L deacetylase family protein [Candidatus Latescibacterota bacterium]
MDAPLTLLVVGGHPADVFDHCGGTLAHHARRGDRVVCLALTHGTRVHDRVISEELRLQQESPEPERLQRLIEERAQVKHAEVVKACGLLGIREVRFLDCDDDVLLVTQELVAALARLVRQVRPDIVVTHYPLEGAGIGSHHAETGKLVLHALSSAANVSPGDPHPGHRIAQLFFMSPEPATFVSSYLAGQATAFCDTYVDVTDVAELKVRALACMGSQQYGADYARKAVEAVSGKDGLYMRVPYAEGFIRNYPEIGEHLPVSRQRLARANEPESAMHARTDVLIAPFVRLADEG